MKRLPDDEQKLRYELHRLGYTDLQAAKICGIKPNIFASWRTSRKLPVNKKTEFRNRKLMQLWQEGKNVDEIAVAVNLSKERVKKTLRQLGIDVYVVTSVPMESVLSEDQCEWMRLALRIICTQHKNGKRELGEMLQVAREYISEKKRELQLLSLKT